MDRSINVISYAGARGEERPLAVRGGGEAIRVAAIRQMWLETGPEPGAGVRRWFELELEGGQRLAIYYDEALDGWFCREDARLRPTGQWEVGHGRARRMRINWLQPMRHPRPPSLVVRTCRAWLLSGLLTACALAEPPPVPPPFVPSRAFDGRYEGERIDVSGDGMCRPTRISGTVTNGYVRLRLEYNYTLLTGWVAPDGTVALQHDHPRWDYRFSGKAEGDEIRGHWSVGNAPCRGTWLVKRKSRLHSAGQ